MTWFAWPTSEKSLDPGLRRDDELKRDTAIPLTDTQGFPK
jgi:hypothetical protein